jgi:hypothetical protein
VDQIQINAIDTGHAQGKTRILRLLTTKNDRGYQCLAPMQRMGWGAG